MAINTNLLFVVNFEQLLARNTRRGCAIKKILETISDRFWFTVDCAKTLLNLMDSRQNFMKINFPSLQNKYTKNIKKILETISDRFWFTVDCAKTLLNLMDSNIYND